MAHLWATSTAMLLALVVGMYAATAPTAGAATTCAPKKAYTAVADAIFVSPSDALSVTGITSGVRPTAAEAATFCRYEPRCSSWDSRGGYTLGPVLHDTQPAPGVCSYRKDLCPPIPGFTAYADFDVNSQAQPPRERLSGNCLADVHKACEADPTCLAFNKMRYVWGVGGTLGGVAGNGAELRSHMQSMPGSCVYVKTAGDCAPTSWWCSGWADVLTRADCDGDAFPDWVCINSYSGARAAVATARGCASDAASVGWPRAPASLCPSVFKGPPPCVPPSYWCTDTQRGDNITHVDCDGDGLKDWVCVSEIAGSRSAITSSRNCSLEDKATGWPRADQSICPAVFKGPAPCIISADWCIESRRGDNITHIDCDGDGLKDWVCVSEIAGNRGAITSSRNCSLEDKATGWPRADQSICPAVFKGPAPCIISADWCIESRRGDNMTHIDCDGDGLKDWVCVSEIAGNRGAITSSRNCSLEDKATGWPRADQSICPAVFKGPAPCIIPADWCIESRRGDNITHVDCDGDGLKDWVCVSEIAGNRGAITSSRNCSLEDKATGWPRADQSICPAVFKGPAPCLLPPSSYWCSGAADTLHHLDCDGDGLKDWVCVRGFASTGDRRGLGAQTSRRNCNAADATTGWAIPAAAVDGTPDICPPTTTTTATTTRRLV